MDNTETAKDELRKNLTDKYNIKTSDAKNLSNSITSKMTNLSTMNMPMLAAAIYYQQQNRKQGGGVGPPLNENIVKQIKMHDSKLASMNQSSLKISLIRHLRYIDLTSQENE